MLPKRQPELMADYPPPRMSKPPRRQLTGAKEWSALFLVLMLVACVYIGLYPWAFLMGGNFHLLPYWCGWGRMHSSTAGDYLLYVEISPFTRYVQSVVPQTNVTGRSLLCAPTGERYSLDLDGAMPPHVFVNTVGLPINLHMSHESFNGQSRPSLAISGLWGKGEIVGDDRETLSQSFLPNGRLIPGGTYAVPSQREDVQVTLHEGSFSEWKSACSHIRR
jgi:hypothetical protein